MALDTLEKGLFTDGPRLPGRVPGKHPSQFSTSVAAEDTFKFGQGVMEGTDPLQALLFQGAGKKFIGIARWSADGSKAVVPAEEQDPIDGYLEGDSVSKTENGYMNVVVREAVSKGDPVRVRHSAGNEGDFVTSAVANETSLIGGLIFATDALVDKVATIELSGLPNMTTTDDT